MIPQKGVPPEKWRLASRKKSPVEHYVAWLLSRAEEFVWFDLRWKEITTVAAALLERPRLTSADVHKVIAQVNHQTR